MDLSESPNLDSRDTHRPSEEFPEAKQLTIRVNPARLAWGKYDHARNREIGEGDIHASYSADTIATSGKTRRAFRWQAHTMVAVSLSRRDGIEQAEAYQLVPIGAFAGTAMSYGERTGTAESAEAARNDPNGFYHGMRVTGGRAIFVLAGPPVIFVADAAPERPEVGPDGEGEQLSLF